MTRPITAPTQGSGTPWAGPTSTAATSLERELHVCRRGRQGLKSFSIAHDLRYKDPPDQAQRWLRAQQASSCSPVPGARRRTCKDNNDMLHGGHLRPEYARAWARYFREFVES